MQLPGSGDLRRQDRAQPLRRELHQRAIVEHAGRVDDAAQAT
jgi:hypothetical protein